MDKLTECFLTLLAGCMGWQSIHWYTGLPIEKCREIYELYLSLKKAQENEK